MYTFRTLRSSQKLSLSRDFDALKNQSDVKRKQVERLYTAGIYLYKLF